MYIYNYTSLTPVTFYRFIIYRYYNKGKSHEDFMMELQAKLLGKQEVKVLDTHTHTFKKEKYHTKQPRCKWCTLKFTAKHARYTWYYCRECEVPLCKDGECFKKYHDSEAVAKARHTSTLAKLNRNKRKR